MASSRKESLKIEEHEELINQRQRLRCESGIPDSYQMESEEQRRCSSKMVEKTRIIPNVNSVITISLKNSHICRGNSRRRASTKLHSCRLFGRDHGINMRRKKNKWLNSNRNSRSELSTGSEEEILTLKKPRSMSEWKLENPGGNSGLRSRKKQFDRITSRRLNQVLFTFISETSLHGMKQMWHGPPFRRFFYICLVVSMACFLAYVLIETFVDYRRFPYTQQYTASIKSELNFPGITVCNVNNNRYEKSMHKMSNWTAEDYYNEYYDSIHLHRCTLGERNCTQNWMKKFIRIRDEENLCLVFNVVLDPFQKEIVNITKLGILNGLSVVFSLKPQNADEVSYGVIVYLHEPSLLPTEYESTFVAAPGYSTYAVINPEKMTVLGNPYRSEVCIESPPYGYNYAQCERNCAYKYVESRCRCQLPFKTESQRRKCLVRDIPCIRREHTIFLAKQSSLNKCKCLKRCSSMLYNTQISTAYRPRNKTIPDHVEIYMYYQRLVMKEVKEIPKYSLDKIISQFGGQMGIFLGSSIVTVYEILEVVLKLILQSLRRTISKHIFFSNTDYP